MHFIADTHTERLHFYFFVIIYEVFLEVFLYVWEEKTVEFLSPCPHTILFFILFIIIPKEREFAAAQTVAPTAFFSVFCFSLPTL